MAQTDYSLRAALHDLGLVLLVPAALAVTGLAVALAEGEGAAALGFGVTASVGGGLGGAALVGLRAERPRSALLARRTMAKPVVALGWALAAVLAALPFGFAAHAEAALPAAQVFADPVNALFESMSGLTSTGLTVTPDAGELTRSLQWWRSLLQWVGGIGILYFALALAPDERDGSHVSELREEMDTQQAGGVRHIGAVWGIYLGYTLLAILAFWMAGMPGWAAVNHGMTMLATGGFGVTGESFAPYGPGLWLIGIVAMGLGAISFGVHYAVLLGGRPAEVFRDAQNRLLALLMGAGGLALGAALALSGQDVPAIEVAFLWVSALATAGFATQPLQDWTVVPLLLIVAAMFVGAASGSTAGGLKQSRAVWLIRAVRGRARAGGAAVRVRAAVRQVVRLGVALGAGTAALTLLGGPEVGVLDALFESASALGTVGLSVGVTGPDLPAGGRLVLIGLMWAGRLEIAAVLALFLRR